MHYFIDGYNLLFRLLHGSGDLQSQREAIIYDLNKKISLIKLDVSIVFDAAFQIGERTRSHYEALEILFTAAGETADEYILDEIKNNPDPRQEIVVTSDKALAWRARSCAAHTESVEEFMFWLNRAYKNKIRQVKKEKHKRESAAAPATQTLPIHRPSPPGPRSFPHPSTPRSLIPPKDAPLEAYSDYYMQVFESEWKEILQKEELRKKQMTASSATQKRPPRKPKLRRDPLATPPTTEATEEKAATEMERWLKIFERRSRDS
jgi:predicted RNA-binding protein with PIN domain